MERSRIKYLRTVAALLTAFLIGVGNTLLNSTLMDFAEILQTNIETVSIGISIRAIGACIGSLAVGKILEHSETITVLSVFEAISGVSAILITHTALIYVYYTLIFVIGFVLTAMDVITYVILSEVWRQRSAPWIQSLTFCSSFAAIITPIVIASYVSENNESNKNKTTANVIRNNCTMNLNVNCNYDISYKDAQRHESQIWIPYLAFGVINITIAVISIICQKCFRNSNDNTILSGSVSGNGSGSGSAEQRNDNQQANESTIISSNRHESKAYRNMVILICCLVVMCACCAQLTFQQFWVSFATFLDLGIRKSNAVRMLSALSFSSAVGNLSTTLMASKLNALTILTLMTITITIGNVLLLLFANKSVAMLWIAAIILTLPLNCFYPSIYNCLHERVHMKSWVASLLMFSSIFALAIGFPVFIGRFIESMPFILIFTIFILIAVLLISGIVLYCLDLNQRRSNRIMLND